MSGFENAHLQQSCLTLSSMRFEVSYDITSWQPLFANVWRLYCMPKVVVGPNYVASSSTRIAM